MSASRRDFLRALAQPPAKPRPAPPAPVADALPEHLLERYSRQLVLPEWSEAAQLRLTGAAVLVVGAGALGSPVAAYLAAAGAGRLGIADADVVEESNLARQVLHYTPDIGAPKVLSAAAKLRFLNPEIVVEPYQVRLDSGNAAGLVTGHQLVVDCTDAFQSRYLVNAACCAAGVPLVSGAVTGFTGLVMTVLPGKTACYRCAFPAPPPEGSVPSCAQAGVLGPAAGTIGSLMALEALKLLGGIPGALTDAFLQVDLREPALLRVGTSRRPDCPDCGRR